jgi:hypothetical protein
LVLEAFEWLTAEARCGLRIRKIDRAKHALSNVEGSAKCAKKKYLLTCPNLAAFPTS